MDIIFERINMDLWPKTVPCGPYRKFNVPGMWTAWALETGMPKSGRHQEA
jgi:hypothetical protein